MPRSWLVEDGLTTSSSGPMGIGVGDEEAMLPWSHVKNSGMADQKDSIGGTAGSWCPSMTSQSLSISSLNGWSHLIALLGMPHHTSAYDHVRHWTHGQWAIGPQYLVRVLVLVLWAVKPWRFASLSDLWAVDWPGRSVKWTKRCQHEWESDGNYGTPPSPFHRLLAFAQRSNGRGGPRRARAKSLEAPVAPVRAYDLAQGASQV